MSLITEGRTKAIARKKRLTVTDIIGKEVEQWQQGEIITIEAGTGVGKSYFIKNTLYEKAKREGTKILFLLNRTRLSEQFQREIEQDNKGDTIDIFLYQTIESALRKKSRVFSNKYQYIVSDEFHYFLTESKFNFNTEDSFNMILADTNKTKIFMSATADSSIEYFKHKGIQYRSYNVPHDYSHIKELIFYRNDKVLEKFLHTIPKNQKVICFTKSATRAADLHLLFKDSLFVCAEKTVSGVGKKIDKEKISHMLVNEMFEEKFLFTTSTLDNGINLKDRQIKYVIADIEDVDTLIQCLGRKRIIDGRDKVTIIIKDMSNKMMNKKMVQCERTIVPAKYLLETGSAEYIKKYRRSNNPLIYDKAAKNVVGYEKVVNEIRYFKECYDQNLYNNLLNKEEGYINYMKDKLGQVNHSVLDDTVNKATISDYLDCIVGKRLYKDDQAELIKRIDLRDGRGRLQKDCDQLNMYFLKNDLPYSLNNNDRTNKDRRRKLEDGQINPNYNKRCWILAKYQAFDV
ncbi:DEAD/DEAH box helicase [Paenibacillus sp. FSL L8-0435]|uniref:DEAD/DEAH box helicase n=1 Tax=Paenibacillus sp. FSL L8-0435 TaxID=2954618 RepID=UPI0030D753E0